MALALGVSTGAQADKSEWFDVISYGNTTIAQDSPDDFGPWKMMVQPAAGPQPIAALSTPQTPSPRTNINPTPIPKPINVTGTYRLIDSSSISRSDTCTGKRC
jgi:hypothetical protein